MSASWSLMKSHYLNFGTKLYKLRKHRSQLGQLSGKRYFQSSVSLLKEKKKPSYEPVKYSTQTPEGSKKDIRCDLPAAYSPQYVEAAWYDWWVQQGFFSPHSQGEKRSGERFVMCLPPPNVTGTLHLGHALTCAIQDALVRWHRMLGAEVLWVPGCDHAGIATQVVVEKQLWKEEQKTRHDLGREEFLARVWDWKDRKGDTIFSQMRKLGASLDWSRSVFTMDDVMSRAVTEVFVRLHEEGLIYRANRLVNWSCQLKSAISDIEVENVKLEGPTKVIVPGYTRPQVFGEITIFDYPVLQSNEKITVATTRLETMLGDTAVAVHPDDPRYSHLHGNHVVHPVDGRHIPIICDNSVDMQFGTGAVKITPSHDPNDYQIGTRHNLPHRNVINDVGEMENVPQEFVGMKRFDARRAVERVLKEKGFLQEKQPHSMVLPVCSRSKDIIEPRIKSQWYVNCDEIAGQAVQAVEQGQLEFVPDYYRKIWYEFLRDSEDWCISRQIWWGHRIPAYRVIHSSQADTDGETWVSGRDMEEAYRKAEEQLGQSREHFCLEQDEDVLDTWFSSALFPFSAHGWPDQTEDLLRFYPCSLMETGSDILFFWVARMVMLGYKMTGQLPFNKVMLHGILRDSQGRKMSKSLGNVIDPMDVIRGISLEELHKQTALGNLDPAEIQTARKGQRAEFPDGIPECGADALRFALCSYNVTDPEMSLNIGHVQSCRHFCNKIWQGFRFITDNLDHDFSPPADTMDLSCHTPVDQWILSRLGHMVSQCHTNFTNYSLHQVTSALYTFWFSDFCDIYLEYTKHVFRDGDAEDVAMVRGILHHCLDTFLRSLSPFMPFLSEELFQRLPHRGDNPPQSVCLAAYPNPSQYPVSSNELEGQIDEVKDVCTGIMSTVQGLHLPRKQVQVFVHCDQAKLEIFKPYLEVFNILTQRTAVTMVTTKESIPSGCFFKVINPTVTAFIKCEGEIDFRTEITRLNKKRENLQKKVAILEKQLGKFQSRRQAHLATDTQGKIALIHEDMGNLDQFLSQLETLSDLSAVSS